MPERDAAARLRRHFESFGRIEARAQRSPLYALLSEAVVADEALLALASEAQRGQPAPNLFFAAVQYVLEDHRDDALAAYYPALGGARAPDDSAPQALRSFCAEHRDEIAGLLRTRLVQTNEVRRSAMLLPAFRYIADAAGRAPLALIEIGASAGLNLLFDRYAYDYSGVAAGDAGSALCIATEVRGEAPPVAPTPAVASRYGVELAVLDVRDDEDMRWLRALVWPEHDERRRMLAAAVEIARRDPPEVIAGDVFELLPASVRGAPREAAVVLVATFVLNQFTPEMRRRLKQQVLDLSRYRPVRFVVAGAAEWAGAPTAADGTAEVWLVEAEVRRGRSRRLAVVDPHGTWIDWRPGPVQEW